MKERFTGWNNKDPSDQHGINWWDLHAPSEHAWWGS